MEERVRVIIDGYIKDVNEVCHKLLEGINEQENLRLRTKWDFFEYRSIAGRMEFDVNGIGYRLHGKGCFAFSDDFFLNWDFGYRSRWCGIDPWMLGMTLRRNESDCPEFYDGKLINDACRQALADGRMFEKYGLYYYSIPAEETFKPDFPEDFDRLVIEHFEDRWDLPRNKVIDRFLRKSTRIHNQVYNSENLYFLRFFSRGKEVYSIPYDDVCYPENSIKIMSDDILRNLKV